MNYDFKKIEAKWQKYWAENQTFKAENNSDKEKFYVLDMFPYPSGAGLHVGHPLGYIASDIYARYKRHQGFNVLHPMGYDSFGLPAEQYAIQTGLHPAVTTSINIDGCLDAAGNILPKYLNVDDSIKNEALIDKTIATSKKDENYQENIIKGYRKQLDKIGFSFDWSREVRTSNPDYYKWTQWIFIQLFNSWYNKDSDKAEDIATLIALFEKDGNATVNAVSDEDIPVFTADEWNTFDPKKQQELLLQYRLTYLAETEVNWCPALGTVLANDEIINGVSERGGHPVVRKKMTQWSMRISAYAQRLLDDLNTIDWPQPLKDSQTNWIGRSQGASVTFKVLPLTPSEGGGTDSSSPRYYTGNSEIYGILLERAKEMRKNPTAAEAKLWDELRNRNLNDKFRRQHPISNYIVDFVCIEKNLIIEVDGEIHQYQLEKDDERELLLEQKKGFTVLRFSNDDVLNNIEAVIAKIEKKLSSLSSGEGWGEVDLDRGIEVFTTRPDTIFGVSFMVLAPEHELVATITTPEQKAEVEAYIQATAKRSERERMADVKTISGAFTGAYAEHPFSKEPIPVWIGDYVLAGYGTGAVMSVPCGDQRDYDFAKHFNIPIPNIFEGVDISEEAHADKDKTVIANSDFLNGLPYKKAMKLAIYELEKLGQGKGKINYRLRDAVFSRQRYWGEPFPVYYVDGMPQMIATEHLPIALPVVEKYLPTETGEPPLGNATVWAWNTVTNKVVDNSEIDNATVWPLELNTMPGWAGSSFYFNRYMDPTNTEAIFSEDAMNYWQDVDLYIGGSEHATGHLLYARFWQKFLFDKGVVPKKEFAKKLINQGMITGTSAFVYREEESGQIISKGLIDGKIVSPIHADVSFVNASDELDIEAFKNWREEYKDAAFVLEDGKYIVGREVEKMSKSKYNVVSPDSICEDYGADSLRLYEMFLGPLEQSKPWNTAGITGTHGFLKKLWRLYLEDNGAKFTDAAPTKDNLKTLHKTIKKVAEDIENFSFNTSVSTFMICVNELSAQKCTSKEILESLAILVSPYAPHIAEELWEQLGNTTSIATAPFPKFDASHLVESSKEYPISFNGKMRFKLELPLDLSKEEIEATVMAHEKTIEQLQGREPKKVIVVPGKIINIVG
ncbi:leucine--tRNA ligase [Cellulophaga sp. F20128]|uniref:leucine--tRNA ligase n=1 Tax=Cellulophaga sp. F20128 TaxID=2926413 RepID=UPI001FF6A3FD|nr:leucine--tRNA ligase [Cellulophaga sp. F20128]MCK0158617.1 leucine--tRNA ligase [Cellulophaga sp. F20128]